MSGHSKWANIKRKKGIKDQEKAKIFSKLARLITVSVFEGGNITDPEKNIRLRLAIEKAKDQNMPKENILRAMDRAASSDAKELKELVYEGFGPGGISLIIVATTDNTNRSFNEIRTVLEKHGGKIGNIGSALFNFEKCGMIVLSHSLYNEEEVMALSDSLGALDLEEDDEHYTMYIPFEKLGHVRQVLEDREVVAVEPYYRTLQTLQLTHEQLDAVVDLINAVEEQDDVQKVYANIDFPENF